MSSSMLQIKPATPGNKATPNLLPCRINHSGPVEPISDFWTPSQNDDGSKTAFFRGRKLQGKTIKLPAGYRGVVVEQPAEAAAAPQPEEPKVIDLEREDEPKVGSMVAMATFDEVTVWDHEASPDASTDPYVRNMEEWLGLAEQIHAHS